MIDTVLRIALIVQFSIKVTKLALLSQNYSQLWIVPVQILTALCLLVGIPENTLNWPRKVEDIKVRLSEIHISVVQYLTLYHQMGELLDPLSFILIICDIFC